MATSPRQVDHLRLPAQRLRVGGDARPCRRARAWPTRSSSTPAPSPPRPSARRARRSARRAASARRTIIVTGCAAQIAPETLAGDAGGRPRARQHREAAAPDLNRRPRPAARRGRRHHGGARDRAATCRRDGFDGRARAFVQVQQGCDHRCTFCIIPYGRGNARSRAGRIAWSSRSRALRGTAAINEVVLTGVDLTTYRRRPAGHAGAGQIVRRLLALVPELQRLRLSSLDPVEIDDDLLAPDRRGRAADAAPASRPRPATT